MPIQTICTTQREEERVFRLKNAKNYVNKSLIVTFSHSKQLIQEQKEYVSWKGAGK